MMKMKHIVEEDADDLESVQEREDMESEVIPTKK
jgi:hypothetical protein